MITLEKEGVLVIRKNGNLIGFVHTELKEGAKHRAPTFYESSKMGFDELIALHSEDSIRVTGPMPEELNAIVLSTDDDPHSHLRADED